MKEAAGLAEAEAGGGMKDDFADDDEGEAAGGMKLLPLPLAGAAAGWLMVSRGVAVLVFALLPLP